MIETIDNHKTIIRDSLEDADLFARAVLRLPLHDWQGARLYGASKLGTRRRIAIRAPNGAGKDDRIIAPLSLWWLRRYAKGQVVITTKDEKQLNNQTWVSISAHKHLFGEAFKAAVETGEVTGFEDRGLDCTFDNAHTSKCV
jgi:hypothetical protein